MMEPQRNSKREEREIKPQSTQRAQRRELEGKILSSFPSSVLSVCSVVNLICRTREFLTHTQRSAPAFVILILLFVTSPIHALDPFDPFDTETDINTDAESDKDKTPEELIRDAIILQQDERLLDARTKLLRALEKDPKAFSAHMLLADYYLRHVGHFRLALKYIKQAQVLFEGEYGKPPYSTSYAQAIHKDMLNVLSQVRLNLDDYDGSLKVLDEYEGFGYYDEWLPSSRAWVLMKLGRYNEAIKIARVGMLMGANPGHTLNVLGILLSMTGERENSLDVFRKAIKFEMSLGEMGRPATPLNNSGEVYKEIFQEDKARDSWTKAMRLPDGCEHVLPSLNLTLLYLDQLKVEDATSAMDGFESCVAQYPLRNGEEHKALVHLARGRIDILRGNLDSAVAHLEAAVGRQQWFGKIGTSESDLEAAAMMSLGQALKRQNNVMRFKRFESWSGWFGSLRTRIVNDVRTWWLFRRTRQLLINNLNDAEDLYVRHTDSMIEYPTLGEVLRGFPESALEKRITKEMKADNRANAAPYYLAYVGEALLDTFSDARGRRMLSEARNEARAGEDSFLRMHIGTLLLSEYDEHSEAYAALAYDVLTTSRSALRNGGLRLPVRYGDVPRAVRRELGRSAFLLDTRSSLPGEVQYEQKGNTHTLYFISSSPAVPDLKVTQSSVREAVNALSDSLFQIKPA